MGTQLRVLMVEDSADDAELLLYTLRRGGFDVIWQRVENAEAMQSALLGAEWDIITSDHAMPCFSAPQALALARRLCPEIPLIIVSGEINLNLAVSLMKNGAQDYIQKHELARVVPAIERELSDAASRRQQRQTEDELQRQQALMARIYETSPVGISMVDCTGRIIFANPEAERLLGLKKDKITQLTYNAPEWRITAFDGGPFADEDLPFVRVMHTGQPVRDVRHAIEWPDGQRVLLSINATPLTDEAGQITGMVATVYDITEQVNLAEALRESEARFRTLVNSMDDIVFTLDTQGRHTGVYGNWVERTGLAPEHFLARTAGEIMGEEAGRIHAQAHQRAAQGETVIYDWTSSLPDGGQQDYQTSLSPILDDENAVIGIVGVGRNISAYKQAERTLRVREAQLRASLENTPHVAVQWYDQDGRVTYWNPASEALYGWSAAEAFGKTLDQLIYPPKQNAIFMANLQQIMATGKPVGPYESTFHRRDGREGIILSTQFAIPSEGAQPLFVCMDVEITLLKQSQRNLDILFNTIDDLLFVLDMDGQIIHVNDAVTRTLGFSAAELIGQAVLTVHPEERRAEAARIVAAVLAGETHTCPIPVITRDGRQIPVETRVVIGEWDGHPALFGITRDVSALKLSEEKFARAFHSGAVLMAISTVAEGRYLEVNDAFVQTLGFSRQEVIGQTSHALNLFANPEDRDAIRRELGHKQKVENIEVQVRRKDGQILTGIFSVSPIDVGAEPCWLTTMLDITERKQIELEAQHLQNRLAAFFQLMPELASVSRIPNGEFVEISQAFVEITGYTRQDVIGRTAPELGLWVDTGQRDEIMRRLKEQKWVRNFRILARKKSGEIFPLLFSAAMLSLNGEAYMIVAGLDISAQERTEQALRESEEKYRLMVENQQEVIVRGDRDGRLLYVSPSCCKMFGKTQDELLGTSYVSFVHEDDRAIAQQAFASLLTPPHVCYVEHRVLTPNGWRWLAWQDAAVLDQQGQIQAIIGVGRDITEQKKAIQALSQSEERYRLLFEKMLNGFALHEIICDENGSPVDYRFLEVNPGFEQLTGLKAGQLIGRTVLEVMPNTEAYWIETYGDVALHGIPVHFENYARELGKYYEVVAYRSKQGQFATIFTDVTERKLAENALANTKAMLDATIEQTPVPMALVSLPDAILRFANRACLEFLGVQNATSIGKPIADLNQTWQDFDSQGNPVPIQEMPLGRAMRGLATTMQEYYIVRQDGARRWELTTGVPIYNTTGQQVAAYIVFPDITGYKQAEQEIRRLNFELEKRVSERTRQLEAANRELEAFTYSVSHDLRAPLRGIEGYSKMLLENYADLLGEQGRHYLRRLSAAVQQMGQLISDLLDLSRLSRAQINLGEVNLSAMADAIVAELHESEPERVVEFSAVPDLIAWADANLIRIVLDNLLRNAWKFTGKRPVARIEFGSTKSEEGEIVYYLRDNGAGFDMQYADKLFDAFQRLHTMEEFDGTGIGLAIVQRIIHRHGGRVWAESAPDQGATFFITLLAQSHEDS